MIDKKYLLASMLCLTVCQVNAVEPEDDDEENEVMVGLLVGSDNSIYLDGKGQTNIFPFFSVEWDSFYLEGPSLGYKVYENDDMVVSAAVELDGLFNDNRDDSPTLADMTEFDSVFLASINYEYQSEIGEFALSFKSDLSDTHGGYVADVSYGFPLRAAGWMIKPEVKIEWVSQEVNQYYYGVTLEDVTDTRAFYTPEAGINYEVGVSAMYPLMENHAIMLRASYQRYSTEVGDSPIVEDDTETSIGIGWVYRF